MSVLEGAKLILDGWVNTLSGLGTSRDRRSNTLLQAAPELTYQTLDTLYNENWVARRIVELLPAQAFRKEPTGIDENDWKTWHKLNQHELYPHGVFLQGLFAGRCFGGAVVVPGFKYGNPTDPAPEPGPQSAMYWLDVVPWHMLTIDARETDANSPRYKLPKILRIVGQHPRSGLAFHIDRAVICEGAARAQPTVQGNITPWQSVLQAVNETLRDYDVSWGSVSNLLDEASVGVMKLQGLFKMLAEKDQSVAQARMATMVASKSMIRTLFLDADGNESFERTEVSFASLPQLMQQINLRTAGGAGLPATKLFGQEPAGMSATGESDIRQFYDDVAEYRTRNAVKLERLMSWALGKPVELDWPSLWEQTDKEQAETRFLNAQADKIWAVDIGALNALDVAKSRAADGSFGIEVDIAEIENDIKEQALEVERKAAAANANPNAPQPNPPAAKPPAPPLAG
jgi:phage-related protein (TIGR01555 family)